MSLDGFLKIDKEENYTSSDCDNIAKRLLDVKKVGHLGTLDPFATGLLILGINQGTKLFPYIKDEKKTYLASLKLGVETDTLDKTGEVISQKEVPSLDEEKITSVLSSFLGKSQQVPPAYSAKHINGKKAYQLARKGKVVNLPPVDIEVYSIKFFSYENEVLSFEAEVSKGTYIRSLGRDIAYKLGTVGHLIALRRTSIGSISLDGAKKIKEITKEDVLPLLSLCPEIKRIQADEAIAFKAKNGIPLYLNKEKDPFLFIVESDKLLAVYKREEGTSLYRSVKGFSYEKD